MIKPILTFPHTILRQKCKAVKSFGSELRDLIDAMRASMHDQKMGIGIAAPQIGVSLQVALVDVSVRVPKSSEILLINPTILNAEGEFLSHEGCMSLPEYTGYILRAQKIDYQYQDIDGQWIRAKSEGLEAVCIQHEIDHLHGQLFFDRVVTLKTDMRPRQWKKSKKTVS